MHRSIVPPASAALALAALALATTTASGHSGRGPAKAYVCPQRASVVIPCCGPPINGPTAAVCCSVPCLTPRLTISASTDPITAGSKVTVSGALVGSSDVGVTIQLWQKLPGAKKFTQSSTATTTAGGAYSITLAKGKVITNRAWYVTGGGQTSTTLTESVRARVSLTVSHTKHASTLRGTVTPAHSRQVIRLQRQRLGVWVTFARSRLSRKSALRVTYSHAPRENAMVRLMVPADADNIASVSKPVRAVLFAP